MKYPLLRKLEKIQDLKLEVLYYSLWLTGILSCLVFKCLFSSSNLFITISSVLMIISISHILTLLISSSYFLSLHLSQWCL